MSLLKNLSFPQLRSLLGTIVFFGLLSFSCASGNPSGLLGKKLYSDVMSIEGPIPEPVAFEKSKFCEIYQCVRFNGIGDIKTGSYSWLPLNKGVNSSKSLNETQKNITRPEVTISFQDNVVDFIDLYLGKKPEKVLTPATLNMLSRITEFALGSPVSTQKISACYKKLQQQEATCTVGVGVMKTVNGRNRPYEVRFRTTDDGQGYSTVMYGIGFTD